MSTSIRKLFDEKLIQYPKAKIHLKIKPPPFLDHLIEGRIVDRDDTVYVLAMLFDNEMRVFTIPKSNILAIESELNPEWVEMFEDEDDE